MRQPYQPLGFWPSLVANAIVIGVFAYAAYLNARDTDLYRAAIQEDEYLEWGTFWAFIMAAGVFAVAALRQHRTGGGVPWFTAGLAFFCFLFAMEEISWAQRIFAYRPPVYFLEHNFQQEPNLHNIISTSLRKLIVKSVIGGYGIVLPAVAMVPAIGALLRRIGVVAPPLELIAAFGLTLYTYVEYPWKYAGEIVELMLGLAFLLVSLVALSRAAGVDAPAKPTSPVRLTAACAVAMALGLVTAAVARNQRSLWPENIELAQTEVEALKKDILATSDLDRPRFPTKCGLHKRVYTFAVKYKRDELRAGEFARLQARGLPEERAGFFIDPWNAPYWIRDRCSKRRGQRAIFIYSFGPNRRRDSSTWEILGDDIGAYVFVDEGDEEERDG